MRRIPDDPILRSLLPLVYMAWSDGKLAPHEIQFVAGRLRDLGGSEPEQRDAFLAGWLNPDDPPGPGDLEALLGEVRAGASRRAEGERRTLVDLGMEMAGGRREAGAADLVSTEVWEALKEVERALGFMGAEAARELIHRAHPDEGEAVAGALAPLPTHEPSFSVSELRRVLGTPHRELRDRVFDLLSGPEFRRRYGIPTPDYRAQVLEWIEILADEGLGSLGYPEEYGGAGDLGKAIAVFETVAYFDLSLVVKLGVQFGLFGGSVLQLGTERHHREYLARIGRGELLGCFAMTETGHGSNVRDIRTTATWDGEADELVIHTPDVRARKDYIGNAALHGRLATVFAQLHVGEERHGVHAVLVPIRDEAGRVLPGVEIEDCGEKEGLNGVDNGRISFDRVRVPRGNLLDRFGGLSDDGTYDSTIPDRARRFFTMLGTLVAGRISIAAGAVSVAKTGVAIAIRYGDRRRQFGPAGEDEVPVLDYLAYQRRILPLVATTYGLGFATRELARRYADADGETDRDVESLAAGLKAYASDHAVETLQACRELCGGQGYLAENRFGRLKADADIFTTFEGANPVLLQLVARGLLTGLKEEFEEMRIWGVVRHLAGRASTAASERNPVSSRRRSEQHLRDPEFQLGALAYREERLLRTAAQRIRGRIDEGTDSFHAVNEVQDHLLSLARSHVERTIFESFQEAVRKAEMSEREISRGEASGRRPFQDRESDGQKPGAGGIAPVLASLRDLYALSRIEADRGWFLESGYMEGRKAKGIRDQVNDLCRELRADVRGLVDAFGIPDSVLGAPIALE